MIYEMLTNKATLEKVNLLKTLPDRRLTSVAGEGLFVIPWYLIGC